MKMNTDLSRSKIYIKSFGACILKITDSRDIHDVFWRKASKTIGESKKL